MILTFETDRLYIRKAELESVDDINSLVNIYNNSSIMKFFGSPNGLNTNFDNEHIKTFKRYNTLNANLLIFKKDGDECIGCGKIGRVNRFGFHEVDYKSLPKFWGNGFGFEYSNQLINYIYNNLNSKSGIQIEPREENAASIAISKKCGLREVKSLFYYNKESNTKFKTILYRMTKKEYLEKN